MNDREIARVPFEAYRRCAAHTARPASTPASYLPAGFSPREIPTGTRAAMAGADRGAEVRN